MKTIIKITLLFLLATTVFSHGLMVNPPARNAFCGLNEKPDNATTQACIDGFAEDPLGGYQFMSVLTHTEGRAVATTLPEHVCSFDSEVWQGAITPWDVATNWPTNPVQEGPLDITWDIQWGSHFDDTREFHYWITKADFVFDPTEPLKWSDFEDTPFCAEGYDDSNPTANPNVISDKNAVTFTTTCQLPPRNGHHVIYGEWGRNQWTYERFHGCMDIAYDSNNVVPPIAMNQSIELVQDSKASITLVATDSDGSVISYQVAEYPQHGTLTGSGPNLVYTPNIGYFGDDQFSFTATDNDNQTSTTATVDIVVNKFGNNSPVADFTYSVSALEVNFDASASTDIDNDALTYTWDFGDSSSSTGITPSHIYAVAGSYLVSVTVDDGSVSNTVEKTVQVNEASDTVAICEYVVMNEWDNGFTAEIRIINVSTIDINDWSVSWNYNNDTQLTSTWNATVTGQQPYTATPLSWNQLIRPNQTVTFGVQGTFTGTNDIPAITGDICN